jgi:hypothetical protein
MTGNVTGISNLTVGIHVTETGTGPISATSRDAESLAIRPAKRRDESMPELKTDPALLEALERQSNRRPSRDQLESQRISFIMGSLSEESDLTREEVQSVLEAPGGTVLKT